MYLYYLKHRDHTQNHRRQQQCVWVRIWNDKIRIVGVRFVETRNLTTLDHNDKFRDTWIYGESYLPWPNIQGGWKSVRHFKNRSKKDRDRHTKYDLENLDEVRRQCLYIYIYIKIYSETSVSRNRKRPKKKK